MKAVTVDLGARSYHIWIGPVVDPAAMVDEGSGTSVLVVSDSNVDPLYGDRIESTFRRRGARTSRYVVPAGEATKTLQQAEKLYGAALGSGLDRKSLIVALGGGVVGDLAGFVAATYMRGIGLVQVPTTLLAMVDSSVGGKTAVNLPQGKNLVGVFYQPRAVAVDLSTLESLPQREYLSGLAEVVKYGVIRDAELFLRLENNVGALLERDRNLLAEIVARSCEIKAEVVAADECEGGLRAILNYGHTLGHACEAVSGYGTLLHGEAVSIGMAFAARLSVVACGLPSKDADRVISLLDRLGLPVVPCSEGRLLDWSQLCDVMAKDKKVEGGEQRYVLTEALGKAVFGRIVETSMAASVYDSFAGIDRRTG
jgi:3-dehydroquinate synthase